MDILLEGQKIGHLDDVNPIYIDNDFECQNMLMQLKGANITEDIIDKCLIVTTSKEGDTIEFGPLEIIELTALAEKYPDKHNEIMACAHHLINTIDFEGDLPENAYLEAAKLHMELNNVISFISK